MKSVYLWYESSSHKLRRWAKRSLFLKVIDGIHTHIRLELKRPIYVGRFDPSQKEVSWVLSA